MSADLLARLSYPAGAGLVCALCAHRCRLRPGQTGYCGVISYQDGGLRSLADGRLLVLHADPVERKPLYHVLPGSRLLSLGTAGCNMHCDFCQNWRISQAPPDAGTPFTPPATVVAMALEQGCAGIAFTYNEPTIYLDYAVALMQQARRAGLLSVFKTNGYLTGEAIDLLCAPCGQAEEAPLLAAANVDVKGFNDAYYQRVCGARLQPVLDAVARLWQRGVWVEVTTLLIPGVNDSSAELEELAGWLAGVSPDIPWHLWRFHPDYRMAGTPWTPIAAIERAAAIGHAAGLRYIYASNMPGDPRQHTHCPDCGRLHIERQGNNTRQCPPAAGQCRHCGTAIPGIFHTTQVQA
jgi:pyruvate formate lyase activating enzyme